MQSGSKTPLPRNQPAVAIVIAKAGRPVARLVPLESTAPAKRLGLLRGTFSVPDDFDAPLPPETLASFEGRV
jgi:antitoxin (DNA-binding transcriptional repressor) of toxin-antitoxin stability system